MKKIGKLFIPKRYVKNIFDIDYKKLKKYEYKIIIFDLDNTIGSIKEKQIDSESLKFLNKLNKDFKVIIASNSLKNRVKNFCKGLECDTMSFSLKPFGKVLSGVFPYSLILFVITIA